MRRVWLNVMLSLLIVFVISAQTYGQETESQSGYSLWIRANYTDYEDYIGKVGEFSNAGDETLLPELFATYFSKGNGNFFYASAEYLDDNNILAEMKTIAGDRFKGTFKYRSFNRLEGQNLLEAMTAREGVNGNPGGKFLTNEILDPDAGYYTDRKQIESELEVLLSRQHNMKLMVTHRSILQSGSEQSIASNHCLSCHITSQTAEVDKVSHQIKTALQAEMGGHTIGYEFGYRTFESEAPDVYAIYDEAKHPVSGLSGAEFSSRLIFDDGYYVTGGYAKVEKFSHKVRSKGELGPGKYATSLGYSSTTNDNTDLNSTAWTGAFSYTAPVGDKSRLIAKVTGIRYKTDSTFIDLPIYRDGRGGYNGDFDYFRYSALDRADGKASVELIRKMTPKMTAAFLLGFNYIDRYNYPGEDINNTTRFIGQAKMKYRKGLSYSTSLKYRVELTSDPFTSNRGLFEYPGVDSLSLLPGESNFMYYFQREGLRYQAITTEPTMEHQINWKFNWRPNELTNINLGLKFNYDKNGDLDSLDVNHMMMQPHLAINYMPSPKWAVNLGAGLQNYKSSGPITVALFDG